MSFDPDKPFNSLPLLPPKAELETKAVLRNIEVRELSVAESKAK